MKAGSKKFKSCNSNTKKVLPANSYDKAQQTHEEIINKKGSIFDPKFEID